MKTRKLNSRLETFRALAEGKRIVGPYTQEGCYYYLNKEGKLKFNRCGKREDAISTLDVFLDYPPWRELIKE